ncbi:MAG: response regulator [Tannerella sp.]|jgi:signal transduction histidine kinase/ligand-binding sensor domain-containing protein/DNA-binding response OmpR family regulator|nr:response regulator [Tannerella sp.]
MCFNKFIQKIVLIYFFALSFLCKAQDVNFSHISSQSGLSQNTVRAIVEDRKGFIWAGTLDGLIRYDGYKTLSYRPQPNNPNSLPDLRIKDMYVDRDGYIWIKTYKEEFSCYNPATDSFYNFVPEKINDRLVHFSNYHEAGNGDIWLWRDHAGAMRIRKKENFDFSGNYFLTELQNPVRCCNFLYEDSQGFIWLGGTSGLYKISENDDIESYYTNQTLFTFTDATELNGKIYFTTNSSQIFVYNIKSGDFEQINYEKETIFVSTTKLTNSEILLVSLSSGVFTFNVYNNRFDKPSWALDPKLTGEMRMITDKNNGIWLYNLSGIAWYYNQETHHVKQMRLISEDLTNTIDLERFFFYHDSRDLIWIATYGNGLFCYDPRADVLTSYRNTTDKNSLASDFLLSITEDRNGNMWIGSEYAGIIRATTTPDYIRIVRPEKETLVGKSNNVRTIFEDSYDNIWVGTKNRSLYIYDSKLTNNKCISEHINPYSLVEDKNHRMWIGTKGNGLYIFDTRTLNEIAHYTHSRTDSTSLNHDFIFHIIIDSKNRVWIASFGGGIDLVCEDGNGKPTFRHFIQERNARRNVRCLYQDSNGKIWAGTNNAVVCFDPEELIENPDAYIVYENDPDRPRSISNNDIKIIYEDNEKHLWIGTAGGGLNCLQEISYENDAVFETFTTNNGLADDFVSGILEDGDYLWISSENGLSKFDKKNNEFTSYHFSDETYGNNFNENSFVKCRNGNLLWGCLDGLLVFSPKAFLPTRQTPVVTLTELQVESTKEHLNRTENNIGYTDKIKLNYHQNTFTIGFSTLDLRNPDKNKYTYMLEGYDKNWNPTSNLNSATYKNLPHGKYTFKVKGANHDGIWNEEITQLNITITPPWWESVFAYICYAILGIVLFCVILKIILNFNRLNNAVEVEKQLTNHKLRFFTNISHEFRTPLTLINGAVENLNTQTNISPEIARQINVLSRNSTNLSRLIEQLLEFRKIQNNILRLDLEETDMVDFVKEIYSGFQEIASQKHIDYLFSANRDSFFMYIDRKKVDKILYNLLSNAFKFTPKEGRIELSIDINPEHKKCKISIKDNGIGIPKEKQHLLFNRFMQLNFSSAGSGVGLSLVKEFTEVHKGKIDFENNPEGGSIFSVEFSTSNEIYKGENFIPSPQSGTTKARSTISVSMDSATETNEIPVIDDATLSNYKILIIDDNMDIRNFLTDEFSKYFMVDTAEDGKQGLRKAIESNPDMIICDVMMPEMDGFEVVRQLKGEFQTCHIPIILLTAHSSIEHQLEGIESGADAYITKPFSLKYLVARVMKLIDQREILKKRFSKGHVLDLSLITSTDKDKDFANKIEKILEENYSDSRFSVDRFSELVNMRRTIFYKKIKGITGFSPNELIKVKRLKEAAALLLKDEFTISEISYKVGFEDPLYFSKCFKTHFQCAPSKYKNYTAEPSSGIREI